MLRAFDKLQRHRIVLNLNSSDTSRSRVCCLASKISANKTAAMLKKSKTLSIFVLWKSIDKASMTNLLLSCDSLK